MKAGVGNDAVRRRERARPGRAVARLDREAEAGRAHWINIASP